MSDLLRIEGLNKTYGQLDVLQDINCTVRSGEFISILGPSGCGKTTLLRMIMGLEMPDSGHIYHNDVDITRKKPSERGFSIVFQDYALFPHMNLYDNVAYGLKLRKADPGYISERVNATLKMLKLENAVKKYPSQLSGGMQQRAAIARSLVLDCDLLLLDEPFSALDAMVKVNLSEELKEFQRQFGITMIMVTHDQEEGLSLSDRVILMRRGIIEACASPRELYGTTGNEFIQAFVIDQINKRAKYIWDLYRDSEKGGAGHEE